MKLWTQKSAVALFAVVVAAGGLSVKAFADPAGSGRPIDFFPWQHDPLWGYHLVTSGALDAPATGSSSPGTPTQLINPSWKDDRLGRIDFSQRKDQRRGQELFSYRINEDGFIKGDEFLALAHPAEQALFEQVMHERGEQGDLHKLYHDYMQQLTDQGIGLLILNRVLDHEAMKRKMMGDVSDARVDYVMRAVLVQNAIQGNRLSSQALPTAPHEQLYGWLKQTVKDNPVRFNMDWTFTDGGLWSERDALREGGELDWPAVTISFSKLPGTWREFEQQIREKLQPSARVIMRQNVWRTLVGERNPNLQWQTLFSTTTTGMAAVYAAMRDSTFKVQAMDALVQDIRVSGAKASEFKDRYAKLLNDKQESLLNEIFGTNPSGAESQADQDRMRQKILDLRNSVPKALYDQAVGEFAADITGGNLRVSFSERTLHSNGVDAPPADDSVASQQLRTAFNPMFGSMSLFPMQDLVDTDKSIKIMLMKDLKEGAVSYLDMHDDRVEKILRAKLQAKTQGLYFRDLAYALFRENTYQSMTSICSEAGWPCANTDARHLAEAMFPEALFSGQTLGFDGPGRPVTNTLGRSELQGKVMEISLDIFNRVFEIPNDYKALNY